VLAFLRRPPRWFEWLIVGALVIVLVVLITGQATGQKVEIRISILGQEMSIVTGEDRLTLPIDVVVENGLSYVRMESGNIPLRFWLESQGYVVSWSQTDQAILAVKGE
jgi:hypothetical protein